eukprot:927788-Lingulodinium_polyedra.AAC.1
MRASACIAGNAPMLGRGLDWVAVEVRLRGAVVCLVSLYLTTGAGLDEPNRTKWSQLASFANSLAGPLLLVGDMNCM